MPHRERGARVTEGIDVVRTLWRDTPASFKGRFTQFEGVSLDPKPVQKPGPPIWIGGRSDAALDARRPPGRRLGVLRRPGRALRAERRQDPRRRRGGRRPLDGFALAHLGLHHGGPRLGVGQGGVGRSALTQRYAQDFEPLARKYGIIGTPEQCAEQLARFEAAGCNYIIANPIGDPEDERDQLERDRGRRPASAALRSATRRVAARHAARSLPAALA